MENLTDCEQVVMKSVWDAKKDTSLQEVMRYLEEKFHKDWKPDCKYFLTPPDRKRLSSFL